MKVKLTVTTEGEENKKFAFDKDGDYVIGRGPRAHLQIPDSKMSRAHCLLIVQGDCAAVEDLGSMNGTNVDGVTIRGRRNVTDPGAGAGEISTEAFGDPLAEAFNQLDRVDLKEGSIIEMGQSKIYVQLVEDTLQG